MGHFVLVIVGLSEYDIGYVNRKHLKNGLNSLSTGPLPITMTIFLGLFDDHITCIQATIMNVASTFS